MSELNRFSNIEKYRNEMSKHFTFILMKLLDHFLLLYTEVIIYDHELKNFFGRMRFTDFLRLHS